MSAVGTDNNLIRSAKSLKALPIPPAGPPDSRLSSWGSFSPLLQQNSGHLAPASSVEQGHLHAPTRGRFSSQCGGAHSIWGNKLSTQSSHDLQELKHKQSLAQVLDAALPAAETSSDSVTSHASSSSALIPHNKHYSIVEESSDGSQPSSPPSSNPESDLVRVSPRLHHHSRPIAEESSEGSSQPSTPPSACIDADVVVLTGKGGIELASKGPALSDDKSDLIVAGSPTASGKDQHMVVYLQSYMAAAQNVASELSTDASLRCTCHHGPVTVKDVSDVSSGSSESGDSLGSSNTVIGDSWWALLKIVWPFCLAVQPAPMTTATILPLNLSSQVANVSMLS